MVRGAGPHIHVRAFSRAADAIEASA